MTSAITETTTTRQLLLNSLAQQRGRVSRGVGCKSVVYNLMSSKSRWHYSCPPTPTNHLTKCDPAIVHVAALGGNRRCQVIRLQTSCWRRLELPCSQRLVLHITQRYTWQFYFYSHLGLHCHLLQRFTSVVYVTWLSHDWLQIDKVGTE